jgi:Rrf2 family iron-sulfur cluster assembly transcriptional regulator
MLAGILKNLVHAGLVQSRTGPRGGFALARKADRITLYQIMETVDQPEMLSQCVVGLETCSADTPCPVHDRLQEVRQRFVESLQSITVADMAAATAQKKTRALPEWLDEQPPNE